MLNWHPVNEGVSGISDEKTQIWNQLNAWSPV